MNTYLVLITLFLAVCLLILVLNNNQENFKSEYRESDIILPTPVPQFQYELKPANELIIKESDKNNKYPLDKIDMNIVPPTKSKTITDREAAFNDANFVRDKGVEAAMSNYKKKDTTEYLDVINSVTNFNLPKNSQELLKKTNVKNISQNEYDTKSIHDIYNNSVSKVINNISDAQIDNITGKKYMMDDISNTVNVYKPIYVSIDKNII